MIPVVTPTRQIARGSSWRWNHIFHRSAWPVPSENPGVGCNDNSTKTPGNQLGTSWWLNQPIWKNMSQNGNLPQFSGWKYKIFELPAPRELFWKQRWQRRMLQVVFSSKGEEPLDLHSHFGFQKGCRFGPTGPTIWRCPKMAVPNNYGFS